MFTIKIHSWKFFYTTTGRDVRDKLRSGRVRVPSWLLGILGYVGYFRVFWYLREYPKYLVYKSVGYWVPVGPFPWVNFWRICVLDRGANWHLVFDVLVHPQWKLNHRENWRLAQMNNFHGKSALVGSLAFSISILNPIFQLCSNTDQVWGSWFVNPLSEVSKSFYGNQQMLFSPDRWAYHPTHGRPISISLILILVFLGFWNTLSSRPIIT